MASTYLCLNTHIVFATKGRHALIDDRWRHDLHAYIGGIAKNLGATPFAVGGTADHIHLVAGLKATHAPADLVKEIKRGSSIWAAQRSPSFGWQTGYGAFSVGSRELGAVLAYVNRQEEHHRRLSAADELRALLAEHGVVFDERFFE